MKNLEKHAFVVAAMMLVVGCRLQGILPHARGDAGNASSSRLEQPTAVPALSGVASFAASRQAQATMTDVAIGATVSLINTSSNQTVSTSLTDSKGAFSLNFTNNFRPDPALTYYLEAYKGLNGNLPSNAAVRVRTLVRYAGGWISVTGASPGAGVTINPTTTAVAIAASLRHNNPSGVNFAALMGSVNTKNGDAFTPTSGVSAADVTAVRALVLAALGRDGDPVGTIGLTGNDWITLTPGLGLSVTGVAPASGTVGTPVAVSGSGFSLTSSDNVFRFNSAPMTNSSVTGTKLQGTVPNGATSGQTTLQVGTTIVLGPLFTVPPVLTGMSLASGSAGTSLVLTGSGFDVGNLSNNIVTFGDANGTVTSYSSTTGLTVTVPTGATSGKIALTVAGITTLSPESFTVPVSVSGVSPTQCVPGTPVSITGSGFSPVPAKNTVVMSGVQATVLSASANNLVVSAPVVPGPGSVVVTVAGQTATASETFRNLVVLPVDGALDAASPKHVDTLVGSDGATGVLASVYPLFNIYGVGVDPAGNVLVVAAEPGVGGTYYDTRRGGNNNYQYWVAGRIANGVYRRIAGGRAYNPYDTALYGSGFRGDNIPALSGNLYTPTQIAADASGSLYIADSEQHRVRKVSPAGIITTIAGTGTGGFDGDNGPATSAKLNTPHGVAVDAAGNVYIADLHNHRIRKVDQATGKITTVAGSASAGSAGDNGPATSAQLYYPRAIALDATGSLYIAETENHRVRKVDKATGTITTLAGIAGNAGSNGDGGLATSAKLYNPYGVAVDGAGNVFIADYSTHRIRKIDKATGNISTVAGVLNQAGSNGDGGLATSAQLNSPRGVAVDGAGNLYIADYGNHRLRKVNASGIITSLTGDSTGITYPGYYRGDGVQATHAGISPACGVAVDSAGNTYIADTLNHVVRKVDAAGVITTIAGNGPLYYPGDGLAATLAKLKEPHGIAVDEAGNVYVSEYTGHRIRKIERATGVITTIAGNGTAGYGGDGGPGVNAMLYNPAGLALDPASNTLYVADYNNHRIRQIHLGTGKIYTVAGAGNGSGGNGGPATSAGLYNPTGVAFQAPNVLYIADYNNHMVRKAIIGGAITTVAGTGVQGNTGDGASAVNAKLYNPWGVALDRAGNLYITDSNNHRIRKVDPATGLITNHAGTGYAEFSGDGGTPGTSGFSTPKGIAIAEDGTIVVSDTGNTRIRWIR